MMRPERWILTGLCALVLASAACAPAAVPVEATPTPAPVEPSVTPEAPTNEEPAAPTATPTPMEGMAVVDRAVIDLAARLGVQAGEIEIKSIEEMEWPDASLGCPQQGVDYAQVITPGFRVLLASGGASYPYHTDEARLVVLCGSLLEQVPPAPGNLKTPVSDDPGRPDAILIFGPRTEEDDIASGDYAAQVTAAAREDLARRSGLEVGQVQVVAGEYTEVDLAAPCGGGTGRPETGPASEGLALGYEVLLDAGGATHRYVATGGLAYYCGLTS